MYVGGGGGGGVSEMQAENTKICHFWRGEGPENTRALVSQMDIKRPFGEGYFIHKCFLKVSHHHTAGNIVICPCQIDP